MASWRGDIGVIKPTYHTGSLEEFIRLFQEGIGVIPLFLGAGIRRGTVEEFADAVSFYEPHLDVLSKLGVRLIHAEGGPPFMTLGHAGEKQKTDQWEAKYDTVVTSGQTQVAALRALGINKMVGVTYTEGDTNAVVIQYFQEAGIDLVSLDCVGAPFDRRGFISHTEVYALTKAAAAKVQGIDGIFLFGSGWRSLEAIQLLEEDLGLPVVHAVPARVWAVQRMLGVRQPVRGYGRLLETIPDIVS